MRKIVFWYVFGLLQETSFIFQIDNTSLQWNFIKQTNTRSSRCKIILEFRGGAMNVTLFFWKRRGTSRLIWDVRLSPMTAFITSGLFRIRSISDRIQGRKTWRFIQSDFYCSFRSVLEPVDQNFSGLLLHRNWREFRHSVSVHHDLNKSLRRVSNMFRIFCSSSRDHFFISMDVHHIVLVVNTLVVGRCTLQPFLQVPKLDKNYFFISLSPAVGVTFERSLRENCFVTFQVTDQSFPKKFPFWSKRDFFSRSEKVRLHHTM